MATLAACAQPAASPTPASPKAAAPAAGAPTSAPAAAPAQPASGAAATKTLGADYFAGKTITVIAEYSAGGPADVFARLIAQHLQKHMPGQPNFIVENKPGAGGVIGRNFLFNQSKKDGTAMGVFTGPLGNQVFGEDGVQYDSTKFVWLGGVSEPSILYVQKSLGITRAQDLPNAKGEIVVGGLAPNNTQDLNMRSFLNALGVKYRWLTGFPGGNDVYAAALRDEVNFGLVTRTALRTAIRTHVEQGTLIPVVQWGIPQGGKWVRDPHLSDIPLQMEEVVESAKGPEVKQSLDYRANNLVRSIGLTRGIALPPGVSDEVVATYRQAMLAMARDPEFQDAASNQVGGIPLDLIPGEETQKLVEEIFKSVNDDPEALAYVKKLANDKP